MSGHNVPANVNTVLDVSDGRPAEGVDVNLQIYHKGTGGIDAFCPLAEGFVSCHPQNQRACI